jgi:hypothetical protein
MKPGALGQLYNCEKVARFSGVASQSTQPEMAIYAQSIRLYTASMEWAALNSVNRSATAVPTLDPNLVCRVIPASSINSRSYFRQQAPFRSTKQDAKRVTHRSVVGEISRSAKFKPTCSCFDALTTKIAPLPLVTEDAAAMQHESQQENCSEFFCAVSEPLAGPLVLGRVRTARASQVRYHTLGCI